MNTRALAERVKGLPSPASSFIQWPTECFWGSPQTEHKTIALPCFSPTKTDPRGILPLNVEVPFNHHSYSEVNATDLTHLLPTCAEAKRKKEGVEHHLACVHIQGRLAFAYGAEAPSRIHQTPEWRTWRGRGGNIRFWGCRAPRP